MSTSNEIFSMGDTILVLHVKNQETMKRGKGLLRCATNKNIRSIIIIRETTEEHQESLTLCCGTRSLHLISVFGHHLLVGVRHVGTAHHERLVVEDRGRHVDVV